MCRSDKRPPVDGAGAVASGVVQSTWGRGRTGEYKSNFLFWILEQHATTGIQLLFQ
jgi:hypothetical protein